MPDQIAFTPQRCRARAKALREMALKTTDPEERQELIGDGQDGRRTGALAHPLAPGRRCPRTRAAWLTETLRSLTPRIVRFSVVMLPTLWGMPKPHDSARV